MSSASLVLVTGASTGIGLETCARLVRRGERVLAGVRDEEAATRLREVGAEPLRLDVRSDAEVEAARACLDGAREAGATFRGLVCNAGVLAIGSTETVPWDEVRTLWETNYLGALRMVRAFLPALREDRGRIVLVSSISARFAAPFGGLYAGTKAALESLRDSLAVEVRPFGMRVCSVLPGPIATPIWRKRRDAPPASWGPYEPARAAAERSLGLAERRSLPAEKVARAIERCLIARRPPARVVLRGPLGWGSSALLWLPTGWREALLARALRSGEPAR